MRWSKIPIFPTLLVLAAMGTMAALGVWQLGRAEEKRVLIARYKGAATDNSIYQYPKDKAAMKAVLYRHVTIDCAAVAEIRAVAGKNLEARPGFAQVASCRNAAGRSFDVALGWTSDISAPQYEGGKVVGILSPGGRIISNPPLAGLLPLERPDPENLPNNHLAYAGQWFLFALTALVIYILALRRRLNNVK